MITFPHGISDEEIETLSEQTESDVQDTLHDLAVKKKEVNRSWYSRRRSRDKRD